MSTKIYNGYRITNLATTGGLLDYCKVLQKRLINMRFKLINDLFGENYKSKVSDLQHRSFNVEKTQIRDLAIDFSANAVFFPLNGDILFLFFEEQPEYSEIAIQMEGTEYYGYWNNTDCPEDVDEAEFDQRGVNWDKVLGYGIPSETGLSFEFIGYDLPNPSSLDKYKERSKG